MVDRLISFLGAVEGTEVATVVRQSGWLFPTIETLHVMAIVVVVGTIAVVDLRITGLASRDRPVGTVLRETLPYTWVAFMLAVCTGALLFASSAVAYAANGPFRIKVVLLLFAGTNMTLFHWFTRRGLHQWDEVLRPPVAMRAAGFASLLFWAGVVAAGRWIGFTL